MNQPILDCRNVSYSYHNLSGETLALSNLSFQVQAGEFLSIVGPSGCGKSTLLSLIAGLSHPEEGEIIINIEDKSRIGYMLLSKRPARIKKDLPIHLTLKDQTPLAARNAPEFSSYFSILWKEIADEYQKTN